MSVTYSAGLMTAYGAAKDAGYTGTYAQFCQAMRDLAGIVASATTLPAGSQATATYNNGTLSLGIPKGDTGETGPKGDKGDTGATGQTGATGNGIVSVTKTGTSGLVDTYTITFTDGSTTTFTITNGEDGEVTQAQLDAVIDDVTDLKTATSQIPTGSYPDMAVGNVFSDDSYTEDKTPYLYRVSGGGVEVGKIEADTIVGGTVAWNQIANSNLNPGTLYGLTIEKSGNTYTISGTATQQTYIALCNANISTIANHKYYLCGVKQTVTALNGSLYYNDNGTNRHDLGSGILFNCLVTAYPKNLTVVIASGATVDFKYEPQLFDLTQMFGSAVADMIYAMETANAGSGVAFFRSLFPNDYYPYNAGELMHVSGVSEHVMTEKNLLQNTTVIKSGNTFFIGGTSASQYPFKLKAGTYTFSSKGKTASTYWQLEGTSDNNLIHNSTVLSGTFTLPQDGEYRFWFYATNSQASDFYDIQLELGSTATAYEPYEKHSYPLDSSLTLRGIPKLDANNNLYYDGDVYSADGSVQRKYRVVDLGNLDWVDENTRFYTRDLVSLIRKKEGSLNLISTQFIATDRLDVVYNNEKGYMFLSGAGNLSVTKNGYTTASEFHTAMSGVYLVYELATPTEENAQAYTEYQKVSKYGTEEYVSTGIVPVGHATKYPTDIVSKVDGLPSDFSTLIAPTEKGFTATRAYTVNELLIINNVLYKVTANIANGATITPNTNVTQTTLSALIKALSA